MIIFVLTGCMIFFCPKMLFDFFLNKSLHDFFVSIGCMIFFCPEGLRVILKIWGSKA